MPRPPSGLFQAIKIYECKNTYATSIMGGEFVLKISNDTMHR